MRRIKYFILSIVAIILVIIVRCLRPIKLIRFGSLRSERIGHFAANTELYLCKKDIELDDPKALDIFYHSSPISNHQLKIMWDRTLHIYRFARILDYYNKKIPGGKDHIIPWPEGGDRDIHNLFNRVPQHLNFTDKELEMGKDYLMKVGLKENDEFICFTARDPAYLNEISPQHDWSYHDYRNSEINNYITAIEVLANKDYYSFRMGAKVSERIHTSNNKIIDYANNGDRTDFLDIFLSANCKFFISSPTGIDIVPKIFRRPVLHVNYLPIEYVHTWDSRDLFITKKLWLKDEKRLMTFYEIFESGIGKFLTSNQYRNFGIEIIENTDVEITDAVMEMEGRLNGTWSISAEEEKLQNKFWSIFPKSELHGNISSRIGSKFLRDNIALLERSPLHKTLDQV